MPKDYWFILHWLLDRGEVRDRELEKRDRNLLEIQRRYGRAICEGGWWSLTDTGRAALCPVNMGWWALWRGEEHRTPIEDMIAFREKAQVQS